MEEENCIELALYIHIPIKRFMYTVHIQFGSFCSVYIKTWKIKKGIKKHVLGSIACRSWLAGVSAAADGITFNKAEDVVPSRGRNPGQHNIDSYFQAR